MLQASYANCGGNPCRLSRLRKFIVWASFLPAAPGLISAQSLELRNEHLIARFDGRGLHSLELAGSSAPQELGQDAFSIVIGEDTFDSSAAVPDARKSSSEEAIFTFRRSDYTAQVVYRLAPGWQFISKQIRLIAASIRSLRSGDSRTCSRLSTHRR